jgi:hypothetical protein
MHVEVPGLHGPGKVAEAVAKLAAVADFVMKYVKPRF